jgi:hypothetical protein
MRVEDTAPWRAIGEHSDMTGNGALFEGNVQLAFDGVTISASRAQVTQESNGAAVWTLSDARIVRAATSTE